MSGSGSSDATVPDDLQRALQRRLAHLVQRLDPHDHRGLGAGLAETGRELPARADDENMFLSHDSPTQLVFSRHQSTNWVIRLST